MHQLRQLLAERIASGLRRKAITKCSRWATEYRKMGKPYPGAYSFLRHPWAKEMHDCNAERMVGQKGAQLGFTEVALNKCFYNIDILGNSVLYVLPASNPWAGNFSMSRFDPALELSPHLAQLFSDVKNVGHKRAGSANLFIRGSQSRAGLKSDPVALAILDEVEEMNQANIPLIWERMSGQVQKQEFQLSTPTIEDRGINVAFKQSTMDHYFFVCPHCSKLTELLFPECLVVTAEHWTDNKILGSHLICKECQHPLDHTTKPLWLSPDAGAHWVSQQPDKNVRGFHVSQLYSSTVAPYELAISSLKARDNPADEQELYNSKLGLPFEPEGAKVTDKQIAKCTASFHMRDDAIPGKVITMGVDVGKHLHYEIDAWHFDGSVQGTDINQLAECQILKVGKVEHFEQLSELMRQFTVHQCVIDANPETRKALEFARNHWGRVRICYYARGVSQMDLNISADDAHKVNVNRTSWLDLSLGRFRKETISLPLDLPLEYKDHVKALVRVFEKDANDNAVARYLRGSKADHYAHARNYSEIALPLAANLSQSYNIGGVL